MAIDLCLDSAKDVFDEYGTSTSQNFARDISFSDAFFIPLVHFNSSARRWSKIEELKIFDCNIMEKIRPGRSEIKPLGVNASGEIKVEASWGDKSGSKVNIGASGQVSDKNGNFVKAEVKQDSSGEGSASVSAGHKNEKSEKK